MRRGVGRRTNTARATKLTIDDRVLQDFAPLRCEIRAVVVYATDTVSNAAQHDVEEMGFPTTWKTHKKILQHNCKTPSGPCHSHNSGRRP